MPLVLQLVMFVKLYWVIVFADCCACKSWGPVDVLISLITIDSRAPFTSLCASECWTYYFGRRISTQKPWIPQSHQPRRNNNSRKSVMDLDICRRYCDVPLQSAVPICFRLIRYLHPHARASVYKNLHPMRVPYLRCILVLMAGHDVVGMLESHKWIVTCSHGTWKPSIRHLHPISELLRTK